MTPADEIEYIIREIASHDKIHTRKAYTINSFPEICLMKYTTYYLIEIIPKHKQDIDIDEKFEVFRKELNSRKITVENQTVNTDNKIITRGNKLNTYVPIYYKNCIFLSPYVANGEHCENCIAEKE